MIMASPLTTSPRVRSAAHAATWSSLGGCPASGRSLVIGCEAFDVGEAGEDLALAHQALGRVFLAAGLMLNAKRELEAAKQLDPKNPMTLMLLTELAKAPTGQ